MTESLRPAALAMRSQPGGLPGAALGPAGRKPNPSPLQTSQISSPTMASFDARRPSEGSGSRGAESHASTSPRSPPPSSSPRSPLGDVSWERTGSRAGGGSLYNESRSASAAGVANASPATPKGAHSRPPLSMLPPQPPSGGSYDAPSSSSPTDGATPGRASKPSSGGARLPTNHASALRTASLDSSVSSVSSSTTYSHASTQPPASASGAPADGRAPAVASPSPTAQVADLIAAANGSAEAALHALLRDKAQVDARFQKLWDIMNGQRQTMLNLKKDLDQAATDRDRYRRRLREHAPCLVGSGAHGGKRGTIVGGHREALKRTSPPASPSPAPSEDAAALPIQRFSTDTAPSADKGGGRSRQVSEAESLIDKDRPLTTILKPVPGLAQLDGAEASAASSSNGSERPARAAQPPAAANSNKDDDDDSRRNTIIQAPAKPVAPLEVRKKAPGLENVDTETAQLHLQRQQARQHGGPAGAASPGDAPSPASFSARRSMTHKARKQGSVDTDGALGSPGSPAEPRSATSPGMRKGPPAPLNLNRSPDAPQFPRPPDRPIISAGSTAAVAKAPVAPVDKASDSEYDDDDNDDDAAVEADELPRFERGRKKTRAEDDREREALFIREQQSRSASKKSKKSKARSKSNKDSEVAAVAAAVVVAPVEPTPAAPPIAQGLPTSPRQGLPMSPRAGLPTSPSIRAFAPPTGSTAGSLNALLSPEPASLAGMLSSTGHSPASQPSARSAGTNASLGSAALGAVPPTPLSPGLPTSPRPSDRPMHSPLPRQPREGFASPPQSARLPNFASPLLSPRAPRTPLPVPVTPGVNALTSPPPPPQPLAVDSINVGQASSAGLHKHAPSTSSSHSQPPHSPQSPVSPTLETASTAGSGGGGGGNKLTKSKAGSVRRNELAEVYRGLVSDAHPELLLPPNALPLIRIQVTSARVRPARHSLLSLKSDDAPSFVLGVSARADPRQLWRVEKPAAALQGLYTHLAQAIGEGAAAGGASSPVVELPPMPDRALFSGMSPARSDARRAALEDFFERLLDTPLSERAAVVLCGFLSTHVAQPEEAAIARAHAAADPRDAAALASAAAVVGADGRPAREGYLTKRGKNFGGWKARYFVLADGLLRYYDQPGGPVLGTVRLASAQIGRQSAKAAAAAAGGGHEASPSRAGGTEENEVRHAFLILEPKRRDSKHLVRHVLCAESDAERDEWVQALLQHVEQAPGGAPAAAALEPKTPGGSTSKGASGTGLLSSVMRTTGRDESERRAGSDAAAARSELQGLSYEDTAPGGPLRSGSGTHEAPSPVHAGFGGNTDGAAKAAASAARTISAPRDGGRIHDAAAWGNRPLDSPGPPGAAGAGPKKRNLWGFREKAHAHQGSADSSGGGSGAMEPGSVSGGGSAAAAPPRRPANQRPIFGMPLADAARLHAAPGTAPPVPTVPWRCLRYLAHRRAELEEGLFRLSGSNTLIRALKDRFNADGDVDLVAEGSGVDVNAVASLLKQYLRELPDPVLTRELHLQFLQILERPEVDKLPAFRVLVHRLPLPNWALLRALAQYLLTVVGNAARNRMTARNVAIVFAPTLNVPGPLLSAFITDFDVLFGPGAWPDANIAAGGGATPLSGADEPAPLTPEDIRSPRHQAFSDLPTPAPYQDAFPRTGFGAPGSAVSTTTTTATSITGTPRERSRGRRSDSAGTAASARDPAPPPAMPAHHTPSIGALAGFTPLQPSYEAYTPPPPPGTAHSGTSGRGESPARGTPDSAGMTRAEKAKRRESAMLGVAGMMGAGSRKSSFSGLRGPSGTCSNSGLPARSFADDADMAFTESVPE